MDDIRPFLEEPERVLPDTPLHRLTVFVTYRCNLDCPYCKTIARSPEELAARPQKALAHDLTSFDNLLDPLPPVRHLHFTGGEAALEKRLPDMLQRARERGVERLSLTSNGTLPADRYLALIEAGLDELRISLDASDSRLGGRLTGRRQAWERTVETAKRLGQARRQGVPFHFILNAVIGLENRERLEELVSFLLDLGPDDIKLITDVDRKETLGAFPGAAEQVEAIYRRLPSDGFPLLRRKLETVFAPQAIGLESVRGRDWRCYIPLTERTVDRSHYYPCSVYLRENGEPLGPLTDSPEEQRRRTARFVREGDCLRDPICRRYCLHCTRAFNERANQARELEAAQERLRRWIKIGQRAILPTSLYLLVSPLGMAARPDLRAALAGLGIEVMACQPLPSYARVASAIYVRQSSRAAARRSLDYERAWAELASRWGTAGECWWLSPSRAHLRLDRVKRELRRALAEELRLELNGRSIALHAFHVCDPGDLTREGARLRAAMG